MATVAQAQSPRLVGPPRPPVRHGTCHLELWINGRVYNVRKRRAADRHSKVWWLTRDTAEGGRITYVLAKSRGEIICSCPDASLRGAWCKHSRAMIAAGLINGRSPARKPKGGA